MSGDREDKEFFNLRALCELPYLHLMEPLVLQFQGFVTDLTTVEKRSIVALTEIARDALRTHPHVAPTLANIIIDRIIQVRTHTRAFFRSFP